MPKSPQQQKPPTIAFQLLSIVLSFVLMLIGWFLLFWILLLPIWVYWFGALVIGGFIVWLGYSTGLLPALYKYARAFITPKTPTKSCEILEVPIEIASIAYRLHDLESDEVFSAYLDEPIYSYGSKSNELLSSSEVVEHMILDIVKGFEEDFNGDVSVEAEIHRGSLMVGLKFLVTTYEIVSKYKNVVDSISLARTHLREILSSIASGYKNQTSREIQVLSDISVKSKDKIAKAYRESQNLAQNGQDTYQPVTVTNSFSPASNGQPINVSVSLPASHRSGCIGWIIIFLLISFIVSLIFLSLDEQTARTMIIDNTIQHFSDLLIELGHYLQNLGLNFKSYYYTGP